METNERLNAYRNLNRGIPWETKLPFLSLLISLAIVFVFIAPKYEEMKVVGMQVDLMEKNLEMKGDIAEKIRDYNEINKDLKDEDLEKFGLLLPEENKIEEYIANVGNLAMINRIFVGDFSVEKSRETTEIAIGSKALDLKTVKVSFSSQSNFSDLMLFIDSLEKSIPLIDIRNLKIAKNEKEEKEIRVADDGNRKDFYVIGDEPLESVIFRFDDLNESSDPLQFSGTTTDLKEWSLSLNDGDLRSNVAYNFYAIGIREGKQQTSVNNIVISVESENIENDNEGGEFEDDEEEGDESEDNEAEEKVFVEAEIGFLFYYL